MGKGSTVLGVIALILAAGGLGLGVFSVVNFQVAEGPQGPQGPPGQDGVDGIDGVDAVRNTWYKFNETALVCDPAVYLTFSGLMVEFELGPNESVYFSFTARAHTEAVLGWSRITAYFRVDGIFEFDPSAQVGTYNGDFTVNFMLTLQHVRHDLSPGVHNVTAVIRGTSTANYIHYSTLFVQTFPT